MYLQYKWNKKSVLKKQQGKEIAMEKESSLTKEIAQNASLLPLECKERVLDIMKAMVFTKEVLAKNKEQPNKRAG